MGVFATRSSWLLAAAICLAAGMSIFAQAQSAMQFPTKNWPTHGGDLENTRHSLLKQINTSNVSSLGGAWTADLPGATSVASPVVIDGVMYLTAGPQIHALDAKTGKIIWSFKPEKASPARRGVAVGEGLVFVGLSDTRVVAVDAKTGQQAWISERFGAEPPIRTGITTAPIYAKGVVVTGLVGSEYKPGSRGSVVGLDAKTGRKLWQFYSIPGPGEFGHETWPQDNDSWKGGSGSVWNLPVVDVDLDMVYFEVGNAVPQFAGEIRAGDNLFVASAVALDLKTGKYRWHYQTIHHDLWDADLATPLILFDANIKGKKTKALAAMRTDGHMFLLDRRTGKPIFPVKELPVKQNARLKTSPTQPFPVGDDQVGPNCISPEIIGPGFKGGCFWDAIDFDQFNMMVPISNTRFAPMTYNPDTGLFYITGAVRAYRYRRTEDTWSFMLETNTPGNKLSGNLTALDAGTLKIKWAKRLPFPVANGSGVTSTAGGLFFHGEPNGNLQAYDARTGDLKWEFQTGDSAMGPVVTYETEGQQYVAIAASGTIWAFKLGGTIPPRPAKTPEPSEQGFVGRVFNTDQIAISGPGKDVVNNDVYDEFLYAPQRVKIPAGTTVTWTNTGKMAHDATASDGSWTTGELAPGKSATVTFAKPGTYTYTSKVHPWMLGQLVVE